jgi:hypothetical protein
MMTRDEIAALLQYATIGLAFLLPFINSKTPIFLLIVTIGFLVGVIGDTIVFEGSALAWIATPALCAVAFTAGRKLSSHVRKPSPRQRS